MAETEVSLNYLCDFYLNIADQLLARPEGVVPREVEDRELFRLLSDFYLNPTTGTSGMNKKDSSNLGEANQSSVNQVAKTSSDNSLDVMIV